MANRSYLYSLSNQPTRYSDRPETISGLSEWPYDVPFSYRLLLSGNTQICASLISDGLGDEPTEQKTRLFALTGDFDVGLQRFTRFSEVVRALAGDTAPALIGGLDEALEFLGAHRDRHFLLETVELDTMSESTESALRACVERELAACRNVGAAVEALPVDLGDAVAQLRLAARKQLQRPMDAFFGLRFDDDFDNTRDDKTEYPLGLSWWTEALYFALWNRKEFEAPPPPVEVKVIKFEIDGLE